MKPQTILVEANEHSVSIGLHRPQAKNSLNEQMLRELAAALHDAETLPNIRTIILKGSPEFFCTGMDFQEALTQMRNGADAGADAASNQLYMGLLAAIANSPCVVISLVEGSVMAGGIGLVAASDLVVASPSARFSLSEALWGLLPAMVLPYLIRRVGFQTAYRMTLTTETLTADAALNTHLVDEVTDNPERKLKQLQGRLNRLNKETVQDIKRYFKRHLCEITAEQERAAVMETTRLVRSARVQSTIRNYIEHQILPWENIP